MDSLQPGPSEGELPRDQLETLAEELRGRLTHLIELAERQTRLLERINSTLEETNHILRLLSD